MAEQREHQNWHRTASHGTSSFRRSAKATTIEERVMLCLTAQTTLHYVIEQQYGKRIEFHLNNY
ncbi:hypothetical protein T10_13245 [Trichinella papuae]|uniref:Uncharacterized protein n=1 Tax=Trichinella papuae TaxID=268474 RepID=A0A0V1M144_9BILA|nr:hypothetical protein T10_13245 [Trichinella papuae]